MKAKVQGELFRLFFCHELHLIRKPLKVCFENTIIHNKSVAVAHGITHLSGEAFLDLFFFIHIFLLSGCDLPVYIFEAWRWNGKK